MIEVNTSFRDEYEQFITEGGKGSYQGWLELQLWIARQTDFRRYKTSAEVENNYGLATGTAKKLIADGTLAAVKRSKVWFVCVDEAVERWGDWDNPPPRS